VDLATSRSAAVAVHVLIAEDDTEMRRLLADALRRSGCEVAEAKDGSQLFAVCSAGDGPAFDVIVSDQRMPGRTGLDVLADLRRRGWRGAFVLITAFGDAETHAWASRLGAAVFDKPFDLDELRRRVLALARSPA
jgi:DNA-binding response OmpR family regulator